MANKATPEELDRLADEAADQTCCGETWQHRQDIIRSAIDQALALAAADLIESQRNAVIEECANAAASAIRALKTKDDSAVPVERQCES